MYLRETGTECRRETGPVTGGPKGGLGSPTIFHKLLSVSVANIINRFTNNP